MGKKKKKPPAGHGGKREGAGRPFVYSPKTKTTQIGVMLPTHLVESLDRRVERDELGSRSKAVAEALQQWLKNS